MHSGSSINLGDVGVKPGWGAGFHLRRAIDYIFSMRGELDFFVFNNEDREDGAVQTTFQSGAVHLLVSFNNLSWQTDRKRRVNFYGLMGGGLNRFDVAAKGASPSILSVKNAVQTNLDMGVGIAFRLNDRCNLGVETKAAVLFGQKADLLDGVAREDKDVANYSSIRLNFNLGNKANRSEPLYWVNPMDVVWRELSELNDRPVFDPTDSDDDGVIDMLDKQPDTPPGAEVDIRGVLLDSDGDGVPNHDDPEPFLPNDKVPPGKDLHLLTEEELRDWMEENLRNKDGNLANWFLPMLHFNGDSYQIRYADYGHLASIAKLLKANPELRLVVVGFTDKTASNTYNFNLSYERANAVIQFLVEVHGIARKRLILQYNGEESPLVPDVQDNLMNRRVEFRVATNQDFEMEKPKGKRRN